MSPDQWLASQTEEKPAAALSPDQWLAQQQPAEKEPTRLSPDQWLAQQPVEAKTSNPFKGLVGRAASLAGEGVEAVARVAENLGDKLETAVPISNLTPEQIKEEQQLQPLFNWANSLRQYGREIGYEPSTKLGELPGKPLLIVPFIAERLIASAPDMAAAAVATPVYIVARTNEVLNERLANDNKTLEEATIADVTAATGAATIEAFLERFATRALVKGKAGAEGATVTGRVGKEAGLQAGTEALEEGAGYLGGTAGTVKGVDVAQLAEQMLEGAIVGGGLGAGVQAGKEYYTKKQRAELADIVRSDLEARGETPTEEQIGAIVDNMIRIQKEGKADETGAGTNIGATKRGVSVSEGTEVGGTTGTTTTSTTGGVGGNQGTSGKPGVGEETQQGALTSAKPFEPFIDNNRIMTIAEVNGVKIPFYLSTGRGGKKTVPAGKWYPFFGYGKDNWINKGTEEDINNFYGVPELKEVADKLNKEIGDIRNEMDTGRIPFGWDGKKPISEKIKSRSVFADVNEGLSPSEYGSPDSWLNIDTVVNKLKKGATELTTEETQQSALTPEIINKQQEILDQLDVFKKGLNSVLTKNGTPKQGQKKAVERYKTAIEYANSALYNIQKGLPNLLTTSPELFDRLKTALAQGNYLTDEQKGVPTQLTTQEQQALQDELQQEQSQLNAPFEPLTEESAKFFEQSKVRDTGGQLIPLLHGTTATGEKGEGITQFKLSKEGSLGEGIYLTPQSLIANNYAGMPTPEVIDAMEVEGRTPQAVIDKLREAYRTGEIEPGQVGGNVIPVFADIQNPLIIDTKDRRFDPAVDLLVALGVPRAKAESIVEKANEDKGGITKEVITRARKQGYDGILQYRDGELAEVVAFSPNQIKSVFNKKPTWRSDILNSSPKADQADTDMSKTVHPRVAQAIEANDIQGALKAIKDTAGKFFSEFASRLMELGLNTQISFNQQYALIQNELKKIEGQQNRVITWIQTVKPEVYEKHFNPANMLNRFTGMHDSFKALAEGKLGIDPKMFKQDLIDINKVYSNSITSLQARGTFFVTQNAATFNTVFGGNNNQTVMHEFTHAATHWAINNPTKLTEQQRKSLDNLNTLFRYAKAHTKNPNHNAYKNVHEFVAEAFSNAEFQKELRQMKSAMGSNMSAWSKFIQTVAKLFGVDNVLFHTLANADVLFSANYGATAVTNTLFAPNSFSVSSKKTFQLNVQERLSFLTSLIKGKVKWKDLNKKNLKKFLGTTNEQYRRYLLGALTLDQITDMVGSDMPQFKQYVKEVDAMINTRNRILAEGDKSIKEWSELLETNPEKATQLGNMMIEATIKKIDPDPQGDGHDAAKFQADADLKKAWAAMLAGPDGPKALKIYRDVRTFYEKRAKEYIAIQLQRIRSREEAKGTDPDKINDIIREEHKEITKEMIRPYFPIKRFGDYWLQIGKGESKIFMQFEDAWARDQELEKQKQKLIASGMTEDQVNDKLDVGQGFSEGFGQRLADIAHLQKLKDRIDAETDNIIASTDPSVKADEINSLRDALKDNFDQYYMEQLPTQSIQKMFLHRDNISGPSADMLRAFAVSRQRVAYQRARFQHMPQLFDTLEAARMFLKNVPLEERTRLKDYVNELELNLKNAILEPPKQSGLTTGLTQFGFLHFLTSPASALVNMMAIPGIYVPNAAAKYGMTNTTIALAKYNRLLGGTGFRSTTTGRIEFLSLSRAELENHPVKGGPMIADEDGVLRPATLADVYNEGVARGIIDTTLTHEAAAIGEQPANEYTGRWQKFMYYASLPFHSAEKYNRETAFMASFELAYNRYIEKGYTTQKAYDASLQDARDLTQKTMFNYNTINKPRYFRGDLRNIVLQFKMYPQHMSVLMYKTLKDALGIGIKAEMESFERSYGKDPDFEELKKAKEVELNEMKREALKAFTGMMGFTFVTAGISGLPLFFVFQGVANAMHALFEDDDEPFDAENWFKNWTNRQFGDFFGDTVSRGLLSQATGMNFADRMGINLTDMWFPDVKKSQDEVQYMQNLMINLMGPTIGAGVNYVEAYKRYNDGYTERAIEVMMPAAIKNVLVGTRYMMEGKALTMKGATLDEEITPAEALAQMLGFSPEDTAKKQKSAIEMKSANEKIMSRHNDLLNAFFIAVDGNSPEDMQRVIEKIMKFNATNPAVAIDGEALVNSVQRRYKDRALANITGGMPVNKKLMPYLDGMRDYAR